MDQELSQIAQEEIDQAVLRRFQPPVSIKPFPQQDSFVEDRNQFVAALCTRRAGKTNGLARRFKRTMDRYPGSLSRYITLTRDSARDIMWPVLQEMDENFKWGARFIESNLTMRLPNGSKLRLYGADMKNFVRRLRGTKSPGNAIDEAQEFEPAHLENLIDDIITPTMVDYEESWLALGGTPGPIPRGIYYRVTQENAGEYSVHKWSLYQNPYLPDPHGFVAKLKARKRWDDRNPSLLREYMGQWVLDLESLLIKYDPEKNHYEQLPPARWHYILGIDLGLRDSDALAVLGWSESSPDVYLVEEIATPNQDISSLVSQIDRLSKLYDISKMVIDTGGLGAKIAEEMRRRHHIPVQAADKARKMENVAFLNDWLRLGRFKAKKDSRFAQDSYQVQIDHEKTTPDRLVVKKGFHSDIIDAVLYAFKESPAFTYQEPVPVPKHGTREWAEQEVTDMERAAEEHFRQQEEAAQGPDWGTW